MSFKELNKQRRKLFDSQVEQLYDYYCTEATEEEKLFRSVFREKVLDLMKCSRQKSFELVKAFEQTYAITFVKWHFTKTHPMSDKVKAALLASHKPWTDERRAKHGALTSARQLGKTYTLSASGKRLGKKNLSEQDITVPSFETAGANYEGIIV